MTTLERLKPLISDQMSAADHEITESSRFDEDLMFDGLDYIELTFAVEEEFDIEIPDGDTDRIETVGEAVAYIDRRLAEK